MRRRGWLAALPTLLACLAQAGEIPLPERRSGTDFLSPPLRAMQADDLANPGMLWVLDGERLWHEPAADGTSCAGCHGSAGTAMRGVAARYPAYDEVSGRPVDLAGRIELCRQRHQAAPAFGRESDELLGLAAYVAHQSRGLPVAPAADPRLDPFRRNGERLFEQRLGQLDLSCADCHDRHWGQKLGGATIPQGHPNGYPLYRLEWQALGSLQRRLRGCMAGVRAEPFAPGAPELVDLELYLMTRAAGLPIESPAVRP
ncbi:MAG TPA: sulfur oxidation c-type cytochrome SoxA [Geminicoccaceae bacterium]|nr:sulfur oxidation c-type cytochrome SoxA [Geminicoccus sp.]HMU48957.1 sulfur oxidation c-type cytochrome SoxA [Geminicoccaceae bacterium]